MADAPCDQCRTEVPYFEITRFGSVDAGYRDLCSRCYNEEVTRRGGLRFHHIAFRPIELSDASGAWHRFHFVLRHLSTRLSLEAFEVKAGKRAGYEFQVLGAADVDPSRLMQRLVMEAVQGSLPPALNGNCLRRPGY